MSDDTTPKRADTNDDTEIVQADAPMADTPADGVAVFRASTPFDHQNVIDQTR